MLRIASLLTGGLRRLPDSTKTVLVTVALSLASALASVAFLFLTNQLFSWTYGYYATRSTVFFLLASFLTIVGSSLAVGLLLTRLSPEAAGSGIPQLKAAYWKEVGYVPIKPVLVKFVAGILSIGGGTSLGREGPTVFMGGGLASWLSGFLGYSKRQRRGPALIGASAGLAAAFNTPLAAITFVLEEIVGDLSSRSIGRVLISAIIGAFTVFALIGRQPAFLVPSLEAVSWLHYLLAPLVALAASLLGVAFHKMALAARARVKKSRSLPDWLRPVIGGLITWVLGVAAYLGTGRLGIFSLGYQDLSSVLNNNYLFWIAGIMVVGKLLATVASYGFGGCGGIFSPLLFIGGLTGFFLGGLFSTWLPLTPSDLIVLSAVGMSCCLGTVVKAPLSAMLIVFEMTHQFAIVPALLIGMVVSMAVSRLTGSENFYDAILVQDGHEIHKIRPPLDVQGWRSQGVLAIASPRPVVIRSRDAASLRAVLESHPYACFPWAPEGEALAVVTREALEEALKKGRKPRLETAITCTAENTIAEAAERFIDTHLGFLVVTDAEGGSVVAILTLHDLLRAQAAVSD